MDADIRLVYQKRLGYLLQPAWTSKSENIKNTNNTTYFLAHEILGKQNLSSFTSVRNWLITELKRFGKQGATEWGSTYNGWTLSGMLNLAEFAEDAEIQKLAEMAVDYWLARQGGMTHKGYFTSGAVRPVLAHTSRDPPDVLGEKPPTTTRTEPRHG